MLIKRKGYEKLWKKNLKISIRVECERSRKNEDWHKDYKTQNIRDIEMATGLNFLSKLPKNEQDKLELVIPSNPEILN